MFEKHRELDIVRSDWQRKQKAIEDSTLDASTPLDTWWTGQKTICRMNLLGLDAIGH